MSDLPPLPATLLGRYRHYKGGEYEVIGVARHSETLEPLVVYRPLYGQSCLYPQSRRSYQPHRPGLKVLSRCPASVLTDPAHSSHRAGSVPRLRQIRPNCPSRK